jgi:hypothetical protein
MSLPTLEQTQATLALRQSPLPGLRKLSVEETATAVVLHGTVPSYYQKQLAQETVMPFLAGRKLQNRVLVVPAAQVAEPRVTVS